MQPKKTEKANIDKKIGKYFLVGLAVSIALVITAFEWRFFDQKTKALTSDLKIEEDEMVADVTQQKKRKPPPPAPPEIEIVEDDVEVEEDQPDIKEVDMDQNTAMNLPEGKEEAEKDDKIFMVVEDSPTFPGGEAEMMRYISNNIEYPTMEKENGIEGKVVVNFVVNENGSISNIKILKGVTKGLNEEAKRVVKTMPNWEPGEQRGKPVKVRVNLPIRFSLN
jgi:protein TonB